MRVLNEFGRRLDAHDQQMAKTAAAARQPLSRDEIEQCSRELARAAREELVWARRLASCRNWLMSLGGAVAGIAVAVRAGYGARYWQDRAVAVDTTAELRGCCRPRWPSGRS